MHSAKSSTATIEDEVEELTEDVILDLLASDNIDLKTTTVPDPEQKDSHMINTTPVKMTRVANSYRYWEVEKGNQGSTTLCWAYTSAAIGRFMKPGLKTGTLDAAARKIADNQKNSYNNPKGGNATNAKNALKNIYGITATYHNNFYNYSGVKSQIEGKKLIFAGFLPTGTGTLGHALCVNGYYTEKTAILANETYGASAGKYICINASSGYFYYRMGSSTCRWDITLSF